MIARNSCILRYSIWLKTNKYIIFPLENLEIALFRHQKKGGLSAGKSYCRVIQCFMEDFSRRRILHEKAKQKRRCWCHILVVALKMATIVQFRILGGTFGLMYRLFKSPFHPVCFRFPFFIKVSLSLLPKQPAQFLRRRFQSQLPGK